jgi:hypothetical protein
MAVRFGEGKHPAGMSGALKFSGGVDRWRAFRSLNFGEVGGAFMVDLVSVDEAEESCKDCRFSKKVKGEYCCRRHAPSPAVVSDFRSEWYGPRFPLSGGAENLSPKGGDRCPCSVIGS